MLIVGAAFAFYFKRETETFFFLEFVWTFIGIAVKQTDLQDIKLAALLVAGVLAPSINR
ncbi:hypothetical protein P4361_16885 [Fictibacillus sp. B-59209]|uniref:hypothetical protein n=1 Tax=Fictibacillus sp. B-59209 TaxID=3024873 RepID=UPI002E1AA988|nr:hypothetical protein [Fictibacillus sp. B-59209]